MKYYKRFVRNLNQYHLYPINIDIYELIDKLGNRHHYYDSLFLYNENQYNKYINALIQAGKVVDEQFSVEMTAKKQFEQANLIRFKLKEYNKNNPNNQETINLEKDISISGINNLNTNRLYFDFDNITDLELAKEEASRLVSKLMGYGILKDQILICWSGKKGFSIELYLTQFLSHEDFCNIVDNLTANFKTLDRKIRDFPRVLRIPFTKHPDTKLYKIPISLETLINSSIDEIKKISESILTESEELYETFIQCELPEKIYQLKNFNPTIKKSNDTINELDKHLLNFDLKAKPKWMSPCRYALSEGFFQEGHRNDAFMRVAACLKANGQSAKTCLAWLIEMAEKQAQRESLRLNKTVEPYPREKLEKEIVNKIYSPTWKNGTYSCKTDKLLQDTCKNYNLPCENNRNENKILTLDDLFNSWKNYYQKLGDNVIQTGLQEIDNNIIMTTGMIVSLLGAPSSSKTSFALNIARFNSSQNKKVIYYSLDMSMQQIVTRLIQKYNGENFKTIQRKLSENHEIYDAEIEQAKNEFKNVTFLFGPVNINKIEEDIKEFQDTNNNELKLVILDYLECINGPYNDDIQNSKIIMGQLLNICKLHNICVLLLVQPQKSAGDPREPLHTMRKIKGSSIIEQNSRVILTIWRPGFYPPDPSDDKYASIACVKQNMGLTGQYDYEFDGVRGIYLPLKNKYQLDEVIKKQKQRKREESGRANWGDDI